MPLYHRDIGIPDDITIPTGRVPVFPIEHAWAEAANDRFLRDGESALAIPEHVTLTEENIFEIEVTNGEVTKVCTRIHYDATRDIILVLEPDDDPHAPHRGWTVVTVWSNLKSDQHDTLDKSRYDTP